LVLVSGGTTAASRKLSRFQQDGKARHEIRRGRDSRTTVSDPRTGRFRIADPVFQLNQTACNIRREALRLELA
jgi:hypothetical protein